jgi:putative ABC transport system permease protein
VSAFTLIHRNLFRNRLRTVLTALAIAFSIFLVCAVRTLPSVRDAIFAEAALSLRISVHNKAGLVYHMPLAYVQRVRSLPHVAAVNHFTWFGGIYTEPKDLFPNFAIDPETVGETWPDYGWDPAALEAFRRTRNGALVGVRTMKKFGWAVGDGVTLRGTVFPVDLSFKIVGTVPERGNPIVFWFQRAYLEEAMAPYGGWGRVGMIWARVDRPEHVAPVMAAVDDLFRNSEAETAAETERSFYANFFSSLEGIITVVSAVGFLVVAAIILIAANTAAMSIRERLPELAVLKTLGFRRRLLLVLLLGECVLMAAVGGGVGAVAAYVILNAGQSGWSPILGPLGLFIMPVSVLLDGLFIALTVGIVAGVVPARGAARLNVAAALRALT